MFLPKTKKPSTFLKYLLSYILVFTVLMAAFFLILRSQLSDAYHSQRTDRIQGQLASLRDHLDNEFTFLAQIDAMIVENPDIKLATYQSEGKYIHITANELREYSSASSLIDIIVYYSHYSGYAFSTTEYVTYSDGVFTLTNSARKRTEFDTTPYMDKEYGQLIWLDNGPAEYLLYFPQNRTGAKYTYFYILDTRLIQSQLKSLLSDEVPAVAFLDAQGNYVTGSGFDAFASKTEVFTAAPGIQPLNDEHSLFLSHNLQSGFSVAAVVSEDYLADQVDRAFMSSFLSLLALSILGILVVYVAMLFTYRPLHRFVHTVVKEPGEQKNYLELLQNNYSSLTDRNLQLQESLAGYREFVHKDILGSLLTRQYSLNPGELDKIFEAISRSREVMAVKVPECNDDFLPERISQQLSAAAGSSCFSLQADRGGTFYLVLLASRSDRTRILDAAKKLNKEWEVSFAFSESSESVMDIPMLLKNAEDASRRWPQESLAEYRETEPDPLNYPNEDLNQLALLLRGNQFTAARELIETLLVRPNASPGYFISCIILDCLTIITNSMNQAHIEFEAYRDVFTEAVHLCRSIQYIQNFDELKSLINELLFFYEKEAVDRMLHITPLRQMVESNFCDPNFSISTIAETYHVSPSRMSTLFKSEMGIGFTDCIWKLRLEKAQKLLLTTELSVEEISLLVGYLAHSSFGRKFKQETGMTPSQYREQNAKSEAASQP